MILYPQNQSRDTPSPSPMPDEKFKQIAEVAQNTAGSVLSKLTSFIGNIGDFGFKLAEISDPYKAVVKSAVSTTSPAQTAINNFIAEKPGLITKGISTVKSFLQANVGKLNKLLESTIADTREYAQTVIAGAKSNAFLTSRLHAFDITPVLVGLISSIIGQNQIIYNSLAQIATDLARINPAIGGIITTFLPGLIKHAEGLELQKKKELYESLIATVKETSKLTKDIFGLMKDKLQDIFDQFIDINKAILNFLTGFTVLGPIVETIWPKIQPYVATTMHLVFEPIVKRFNKLFGGLFEKIFFKQKREEVEAVNKIAGTVGKVASLLESINQGIQLLPDKIRTRIESTPIGKAIATTQQIGQSLIGQNTILSSALSAGAIGGVSLLSNAISGGKTEVEIPEPKLAALSAELPELPISSVTGEQSKTILPPSSGNIVTKVLPFVNLGLSKVGKHLSRITAPEFLLQKALPAATLGGIAYFTLIKDAEQRKQQRYLELYTELDKQSPIDNLFYKLSKPVDTVIAKIEQFRDYLDKEQSFIKETLSAFLGKETTETIIERSKKVSDIIRKGLQYVSESLRVETNSFLRYLQYQVKLGEHIVKGIFNIHNLLLDSDFRKAYYELAKAYVSQIVDAFVKSKEEFVETLTQIAKFATSKLTDVVDSKLVPFIAKYSSSLASSIEKYNKQIAQTVTAFADKTYETVKDLSNSIRSVIPIIVGKVDEFIDTIKLAASGVKDVSLHLLKNLPNIPKLFKDKEFRSQFVSELISASKLRELKFIVESNLTSLLSLTKVTLLKTSGLLDNLHTVLDKSLVGISKAADKILQFAENYLPFTAGLLRKTNERITFEIRALINGIKIRTQQLITLLTSREFWQKVIDFSKIAAGIGKAYLTYYGKQLVQTLQQQGKQLLSLFIRESKTVGTNLATTILKQVSFRFIPAITRRIDSFVERIYNATAKVFEFFKPILDKVSFLFKPLVKLYQFFRIPPEVKHIDAQTKILHEDVNKVVDKLEDANQWLKRIHDAIISSQKTSKQIKPNLQTPKTSGSINKTVAESLKEKLRFKEFIDNSFKQTKVLQEIKKDTSKFTNLLGKLKSALSGKLKGLLKGLLKLVGLVAPAIASIISAITGLKDILKSGLFKLAEYLLAGKVGGKLISAAKGVASIAAAPLIEKFLPKSAIKGTAEKEIAKELAASSMPAASSAAKSVADKIKATKSITSTVETQAAKKSVLSKLTSFADKTGLKRAGSFLLKKVGGRLLLNAIPGIGTALMVGLTAYDIMDSLGLTDKIKDTAVSAYRATADFVHTAAHAVKSIVGKFLHFLGFGSEEEEKKLFATETAKSVVKNVAKPLGAAGVILAGTTTTFETSKDIIDNFEHPLTEQHQQITTQTLTNKVRELKSNLENVSTTEQVSPSIVSKTALNIKQPKIETSINDFSKLQEELKTTNEYLQREYEIHKKQLEELQAIRQLLQTHFGGAMNKSATSSAEINVQHTNINSPSVFANVNNSNQTITHNSASDEKDKKEEHSILDFFKHIF